MIKKLKKEARHFLMISSYIRYGSLFQYYFKSAGKSLLRLKIRGIMYPIFIRGKSKTDKGALKYVFHEKYGQYHLPPPGVELNNNSTIVDLGTNIGLTVAHYKNLYPGALVIGYEMDHDNFLIAEKNCSKYKNVYLYNEAVWVENGKVAYSKSATDDSFSLSVISNKRMTEVKSVTIAEIIRKHGLQKIDYLKMDIEGAEINIFKAEELGWMSYVNAVNIEIHQEEKMRAEEYIEILTVNGFKAWKDDKHWAAVLATRNKL